MQVRKAETRKLKPGDPEAKPYLPEKPPEEAQTDADTRATGEKKAKGGEKK